MAFDTNITLAFERVAAEFDALRTQLAGTADGSLAALSTTAKGNLVVALNEVKALADSAVAGAGQNAAQVQATVDAAIAALVDASPGTLDTLNELAAALGDDPNFSATMTTLIGTKANSADVYTKVELGDPTTDFVAAFNAALA